MTLADDVRLVVSHTATVMAMEKSRAHSLGSTIARIDGTSDIVHLEVTSLTPLFGWRSAECRYGENES